MLLAVAPRPSPVSAQGMSLPGSFGVSAGGAATYSIPIRVVPGTAGMVPSLTLDYNSQYGSGFVGVGWSLAGLPAVSRCPQTLVQDGTIGNVNFNTSDRFCLDGQRLVATSGTYGADGTEYRSEVDGFSKVISRGSAGTGPAWFEVRTKSGQILEFGNTPDSKVLVQGSATVRVWSVSKVSDTKGNYFVASYINDAPNGQAYPSRIDYTGNASAGLQPYNSVQFVYETRPDIAPLYHAGALIQTEKRLTNVKAYAGANLVSDYRLTYQLGATTNRSRITSIQLCDGGNNCLPATTLAWQDAGIFGFTQLAAVPGNTYPIPATDIDGKILHVPDWSGDGRGDVLWYDWSNGSNLWYLNAGVANGTLGFDKRIDVITPADLDADSGQMYFGDFNGDGMLDLLWVNQSNGTNRWYFNTGIVNGAPTFTSSLNLIPTSNLSSGNGIYVGDFNGDGLLDILWYYYPDGTNRLFMNTGVVGGVPTFATSLNAIPKGKETIGVYLGDFNGDGMTDVLWVQKDGINRWFTSRGIVNGVPAFEFSLNPIPNSHLIDDTGVMHLGDFNGDGLTDVLWYVPGSGTNRWYLNKGVVNGTPILASYLNPITPSLIDGGNFYTGDWNGDGILDALWHAPSDGTNRWYFSNGVSGGTLSFAAINNPISATDLHLDGSVIYGGDWNGDGVNDLLFFKNTSGVNKWYQNNTAKPDILTSITTGLGATTSITFKPLTDPSVYTKDSGVNAAMFPNVDVAGAAYVVRQVDVSNGVGGTLSTQYSYAGAKSHVQGRGFLGFRQMSVKDLQTNIVDTTTYRQDFPFIGLVASQTRVQGAQELAQTSNTYEFKNAGGGSSLSTPNLTNAPYRVTLSQAQAARNDLNGAALPSVTSTYQYDAYGNATAVTVSAADGFSKTTTNTYSNDTTNWLLGRLTNVTVTSTKP
jgi:hypothetical protein